MDSIGSNRQSWEFIGNSNYKPDKIGQRLLSQRNSQTISLTLIAQLNSGLVGSNNTNTENFQVLLNSYFIAVPKPTNTLFFNSAFKRQPNVYKWCRTVDIIWQAINNAGFQES